MTEKKPLKQYRSVAEKVAVRQRNIQITIGACTVLLSGLTCLRVFGIL